MWLGMHKYIFMSQSIYMGVVRHTWAYQKQLPILHLQCVKAELS